MENKRIILTVTNDLNYDQRMHRICNSLNGHGYDVLLVGRSLSSSLPLEFKPYEQKRLKCHFKKGKLMYAEFNLRLFVYLLFIPVDALCAIDLDTIIPCYLISAIRGSKRVYDAHELFTEQKEIIIRPAIHRLWLRIEKLTVPQFSHGYTVNNFIAKEFYRRYKVNYEVIRNLPRFEALEQKKKTPHFIIYQGAVNEGRSFETLIPAMKNVNASLVICGEGNFFDKLKKLIVENKLNHRVELKGLLTPEELKNFTPSAYVAVTLFENTGLNQYQSLANRFFDYIMAGVPQVCVGYPQYEALNNEFGVAYTIPDTDPATIASALNHLLNDPDLYTKIYHNCLRARQTLNWQTEEQKLIDFYSNLFS